MASRKYSSKVIAAVAYPIGAKFYCKCFTFSPKGRVSHATPNLVVVLYNDKIGNGVICQGLLQRSVMRQPFET